MTTGRRRAHQARRVRDLLRGAILAGAFGEGPMPGEHELAADYSTSRNVIRIALDLLRDEHLVVRIQGSGTFSIPQKAYHRFDGVQPLEDSLRGHLAREVLVVEHLPAPPVVATQLSCNPSDPVIFLERLSLVDSYPVSLRSSYFRAEVVAGFAPEDFAGDLYRRIDASSDLPFNAGRTVFEAIPADPGLADLLHVPVGAPILLIDRVVHLSDGTPFEWSMIYNSTERLALEFAARHVRPDPVGTTS